MLQTFLQMFRKGICKERKKETLFSFEEGACFQPETGFFEKGHPQWMADFHFYEVSTGDRIIYDKTLCGNGIYQYGIASYSAQVEERLIYTYCYQKEENWSMYRGDFSPDGLSGGSEMILEDGWIRLAVRRKDGAEITGEDRRVVTKVLRLLRKEKVYQKKEYYRPEIAQTIRTVAEKRKENSLVFGLMADSHYVINGGWEDSIANLQEVARGTKFDAVIHLGDLTDGMVPLAITKEYTEKVMRDLHSLQVPVYLVLGNHDSNYFQGNPEWMGEEEQSQYYLNRENPWYYVDFEEQNLRCLFLHSFNHREKVRYGFPEEELKWAENTLSETPKEYCVLIFSHVPLLPEMHFWSKEIRNSDKMLEIFEEYVRQGGIILAYLHGHNHADQICYERSFPIVSIGCAKCEYFKDKKPEGATTYDRKPGTVTQELWDVMVVDVKDGKLEFVRFGAGEDRTVFLLNQKNHET